MGLSQYALFIVNSAYCDRVTDRVTLLCYVLVLCYCFYLRISSRDWLVEMALVDLCLSKLVELC